MALFNVARYRLLGNVDATYLNGYYVYVKWDDVAEDFQVDLYDATDTYSSTETTGPDLTVEDYNLFDYQYEFCDTGTLNYFTTDPVNFPYATRIQEANSSICNVGHVCDVAILTLTTTQPSSHSASDGEVTVTASSSGTYAFSLSPFSPSNSGQASGTFTGLEDGTYTVYVLDSYGCTTQRSFTLFAEDTFGVRFRCEFDTPIDTQLPGYSYKIDILERDYSGSVTEVKGGNIPIVIDWQGETEDKYKSVIASQATITLTSETNLQFADLFSGDERQFLIKFYIDEGSGYEIEWQGYILQQGHEEPYLATPYEVKIIAYDCLADLSNIQYNEGATIYGDQSLIKIIAECLDDTELFLNIRSCLTRFEVNHDQTSSDDPLAQTYFDTYFLNGRSKKDVLENILKSFGARIFQSQNYWWIVSIEDTISSALDYREFDQYGVYSTNGTIDTNKNLDYPDGTFRVCWANQDALLRIKQGYKRAIITHDLGLVNNLFFTGRFDFDDFNSYTGLFDGWNVYIGDGSGANYGLAFVNNSGSNAAFVVDFSNAEAGGIATLSSETKTFDFLDGIDFIKFSFDFYIYALFLVPYLRFSWQVKGGSYYLQQDGTWDTSPAYNEFYTNQYGRFNKFEITAATPNVLNISPLSISFKLEGNNPYDYSSLSALESAATVDLPTGTRRAALDTIATSGDTVRYYILQRSQATTSSPDRFRSSSDYHGTTNPKVWFLEQSITTPTVLISGVPTLKNMAERYYIDNVKIEFLPANVQPDSELEYSVTISERNKQNFETTVNFGDLPSTDNAVHIYKNYYKLSDDTPTSAWARVGVSEELKLLDILRYDYSAQYVNGIRILNGTLVGDIIYRFHDCILDLNDSNRAYMNMGLRVDYRNNQYTIEAVEIKGGETGPPAETSGFTEGYSLGFRA